MGLPVKLGDVADELDILMEESVAYVNRETGELISLREEEISAAEHDDLGGDDSLVLDWQADFFEEAKRVLSDERFVELPSRFDIHEYSIMERFCRSQEDAKIRDALLRAISGRGAFCYFKDRIEDFDVREDWFRFKRESLKEIAAEFLEEQGIAYVDS